MSPEHWRHSAKHVLHHPKGGIGIVKLSVGAGREEDGGQDAVRGYDGFVGVHDCMQPGRGQKGDRGQVKAANRALLVRLVMGFFSSLTGPPSSYQREE